MDIEVQYSGKKNDPGENYDARCSILVEGVIVADGGDFSECPEDANLGRDLKFVYRLPQVLRDAWEAGRRGEPFDLTEVENSDD